MAPLPPDCELILFLEGALDDNMPEVLHTGARYNLQLHFMDLYQEGMGNYEGGYQDSIDCVELMDSLLVVYGQDQASSALEQQASFLHLLAQARQLPFHLLDSLQMAQQAIAALRLDIIETMTITPVDVLLLQAQRDELQEHIAELNSIRSSSINYVAEIGETIGNYYSDYVFEENISDHYSYMINIKAYLLTHSIEELNGAQLAKLTHIAGLCPYTFGKPVYYARIILTELGGPELTAYDDTSLCDELENRDYLSKESAETILLYPNPTVDKLTIFSEHVLVADLKIIDVATGQIVLEQSALNLENEKTVNTSQLSSGVYLIKLTNETFDYRQKFVVIK